MLVWWVWGHRLWALAFVSLGFVWLSGGWVAWAVLAVTVAAVGYLAAAGRLALLWAYEEQHKARCRVRWTWKAVVSHGLAPQGHVPSIKGRIRVADGGLRFVVDPAHGTHAGTWREKREMLCAAWHCSEVEIYDRAKRNGTPSGLLDVTCSLAGVMVAPVDWPYGAPDIVPWTRANLPIGTLTGGRPATISLDEASVVVGGPPGGGKSVFLHTLLCSLGLLRDEALVVFDLKGVDLNPWRPRSAAFVHDVLKAPGVFAWLLGLMDARLDLMRNADPPISKWEPWEEGPHITVLIDEFAELPQELYPAVDRLIRLGRAPGISVVTCTQRPAAELGDWYTRIRANSIGRVAMGAVGVDEAAMVLGRHNVPKPYLALPRGVGRVVSGMHVRTFRAYWSEPYVEKVAEVCARRRPGLVMSVESGTVGTDAGCGVADAGADASNVVYLDAGSEDEVADGVGAAELRAVWEALGFDDSGGDGADGGDAPARSA